MQSGVSVALPVIHRYDCEKDVATALHENDSLIHCRPRFPIERICALVMESTAGRAVIIASAPIGTHHPQFRFGSCDHGAPNVVKTGREWASDSAMTIPKFSLIVGRIRNSLAANAAVLSES